MLIFQNDTLENLYSHAETEYPQECCGILLGLRKAGKRIVYSVIQTENTADEKQKDTHFLIKPLDVLKAETSAEKEQLEIVGFYHSHPDYDAIASDEDILHMVSGHSYPIVSVKNGVRVNVRCFEKILQTDTCTQEEILMKEK
ncbi:MAG: M67 family metallopeptidase [Clostridia bacterium]|nr:M67 family metallopeptidase [Clostridia bacterium]